MYVGFLDRQQPILVMDGASNAEYAQGSVVFMRGTTLMARPFDPTTLAFTGEAVVVGDRLLMNLTFMRAGRFQCQRPAP